VYSLIVCSSQAARCEGTEGATLFNLHEQQLAGAESEWVVARTVRQTEDSSVGQRYMVDERPWARDGVGIGTVLRLEPIERRLRRDGVGRRRRGRSLRRSTNPQAARDELVDHHADSILRGVVCRAAQRSLPLPQLGVEVVLYLVATGDVATGACAVAKPSKPSEDTCVGRRGRRRDARPTGSLGLDPRQLAPRQLGGAALPPHSSGRGSRA
jgi:hypothetical protein